jgi:hypothetical protein
LLSIGRVVGIATVLSLSASAGRSQVLQPPASGAAPGAGERPGLFRVGALYLTPYLRIGTLGIDTNVFYTPTDRQADFSVSGGPGLEVVWPFGNKSRLRLDGGLDYLYFARTESQRRLSGYGSALLDLEGVKTSFVVEEHYFQSFSRPSYQVNDRVRQTTEGTTAFLKRRLGERLSLALLGTRRRTETDSQDYLGTDLGQTLTEDEYHARGELRVALSVKSQFVAGGDEAWYRFPRLPERNGTSTLAYGGFRTDETALISGQALGGVRWFRLDADGAPTVSRPYADVDATWNLTSRTKLGGLYTRDLSYSALATAGTAPTVVDERAEVFFDKMLVGNIYLRLFARQSRLISDGDVVLVVPGEGPVVSSRNDRIREAGGELGYQFRPRVRVGVSAFYSKRRSTISTFGVEGLLAGLTVQYNPPQPSFR